MNKFTMRVYGRYVMARGMRGGQLTGTTKLLLPNMPYDGSQLREHTPLLTIPRHILLKGVPPTVPPSMRFLSSGPMATAECFGWLLNGRTLSHSGTGSTAFSVEQDRELVSLNGLENLQNRPDNRLRRMSLEAHVNGPVASVIDVTGGAILASSQFPTAFPAIFVELDSELRGDPKVRREPADHQVDLLTIDLFTTGNLVLTMIDEGSSMAQSITLSPPAPGTEAVFSVTNLCECLASTTKADFEFAQYYRLLETVADNRLIPKLAGHLGEEADCDEPTQVTYDE